MPAPNSRIVDRSAETIFPNFALVREDSRSQCRDDIPELCFSERGQVALPKRTTGMKSNMRISSIIVAGLLVTLAGCAANQKVDEKEWFTTWAMSRSEEH